MNNTTTPKDFFLHLGATIALYVTAIALMNLAFTIIDKVLPDALSMYWNSSSIVWPISILIVLTPLLYTLEWLIAHDIEKMQEKREIWIRRWRIYLTLFLTGATIAGDFIVLINTYLNGEISARFVYKVLIVLIVSAVIFAYYILIKTTDSERSKTWLRVLSITGIVLVLVAIVGGFIVVGSPSTQRAIRFDQQRINDLSSIQWQIVNTFQNTGNIPTSITVLNDPISGFIIPVDPDTKTPYEYIIKGKMEFELCATFSLPSSDISNLNYKPIYGVSDMTDSNWSHPEAGRTCFSRTIDPMKYPIMKK